MTFSEIRFRLQSELTLDQMRGLSAFANTYGLRRFSIVENGHVLEFEFDASRLRPTQVEHVLRMANIPVLERVA
jgi:hypothetical protein